MNTDIIKEPYFEKEMGEKKGKTETCLMFVTVATEVDFVCV